MKSHIKSINELIPEDYIDLIKIALLEDKVNNDITSNAIFDINEPKTVKAIIKTNETGKVAGTQICKEVFNMVAPDAIVNPLVEEGQSVTIGESIVSIEGETHSVLAAERTSLNFLGLLSGIASKVSDIVQLLKPMNIMLLDTRKTIPGFRKLSKYAVHIGGGCNHRLDLSEMGLIKDNHIAACGSVISAIATFKNRYPDAKLEVEVDNMQQLEEALPGMPNLILLDNMSTDELKQATSMIKYFNVKNIVDIKSEASGGFSIDNLERLKNTNVDYVSMGSVTNNIKPLDLTMEISSIV